MPDSIPNKNLDTLRDPVAKVAKMLNISIEQFEQSLRNLDPEFMFQKVSNALQFFANKMQLLEQDPDPASQQKSVENTLELLNSIAEFSEDCLNEMGDLYKADAKQVLQDPAKLQKLKDVFTKLTDAESVEQMNVDLSYAMSLLSKKVLEDQQNYTQGLKDSLGQREKEGLDEKENVASKSISSKRDNALFDPVRVIGHLLAVLIHLEFIVPTEQELYKYGFNFDGKQPDEFLDFNSKRFANSDVLPGAPPVGPGPTGPMGGKPGMAY